MRRLLPEPLADLSDEDLRRAYDFPDARPWVRGSMVSTLDGVMRGPDGSSRSIASAADRRVFSLLRMTADVVLVGAGTVRAERYGPSRRPIAIVSGRLDLNPAMPLFSERTASTPRTIILTTAGAAAHPPEGLERLADIVCCGDNTVDLAVAIGELHARGLGRIHCEGGPTLLGSLAAADLIDEVLLTLTPALMGGGDADHILTVDGGLHPALHLRTRQVLEEDGTVFLRVSR